MIEKKCFKCEEIKPISDFYKHAQMRDGHLNKCKDCSKSDSTSNRNKNIEKVRAYDRQRGNRQSKTYRDERKKKYPLKHKAHTLVSNAIAKGQLHREPCEICKEEKTHAHHDDYLKPLNVRWLCPAHHSQWHAENGEAKNP